MIHVFVVLAKNTKNVVRREVIMSDDAKFLTDSITMADALLRLKALENILISKKIMTQDEFKKELGVISGVILKEILKKAMVPGNLDELINNLQNIKPEVV